MALVALLGQGVAAALAAPAATRGASAAPHAAPGSAKPPRAAPDDSAASRSAAADSLAVLEAEYAAYFDSTMGDSVREPRLYLSWGAPHGMPGARADVDFACRDTNEVDTLYLSFETGRDVPRFYAMIAYLNIRPAAGDSLGAFWDHSQGGANRGGLVIQVEPDESFPCPRPFQRQGLGAPLYDFCPSKGQLFVAYAVTMRDPIPLLADTRYCFARVLFKQKHCRLPGAGQPVCIEWEKAECSHGVKSFLITRGPERFVSVNSPGGDVCTPHRAFGKPPVWLPRPKAPVKPPHRPRL